ncbi:MAG TPA: hypothetical protein VN258_06610 [Mobilitalea sp.]|nr:hypothetical protein [Mobilitalea sp.]
MERLTHWNEEKSLYEAFDGDTHQIALDILAHYENTGLTPEEIKALKSRLDYQEALTDAWESNAQSGSNLAHKYRDLLLKARADRDYWELEAKKAVAKLGEIQILMKGSGAE